MKKMMGVLLFFILILTGCSSDDDYISTVRNMSFSDGQSLEKYVENNIKAGEIFKFNESNFLFDGRVLFFLSIEEKSEVISFLKECKVKLPEDNSSIKWEIEGETKEGKIVVAFNDNIKVKIETTKNGDYIETNTNKIFTYDKSNNKLISQDNLNNALTLYEIATKCGYTGLEDVYKRFNEKAVLENKDGFYTLEYHPSGRVKHLSDEMIYVELEDRSYIKDISKSLDYLDKEIEKYTDDSINKLVDFSMELEYNIIAEKLNKKITDNDRREIKKLEEKANRVFDKLDNQVNKMY